MDTYVEPVSVGNLDLHVVDGTASVSLFWRFLQAGFHFACEVNRSVEDLLLRQLALSSDFVEEKVTTVFVDGCCVDDIAVAMIGENSVLALSSAMPGLAGASLRRSGHYASLRGAITYHKGEEMLMPCAGTVSVKLFNLLIGEMGPVFLNAGIMVESEALCHSLEGLQDHILHKLDSVLLDGKQISPDQLSATIVRYGRVQTRVRVATGIVRDGG